MDSVLSIVGRVEIDEGAEDVVAVVLPLRCFTFVRPTVRATVAAADNIVRRTRERTRVVLCFMRARSNPIFSGQDKMAQPL